MDMPAPAAHPGTAATTGTGQATMAVTSSWNALAKPPTNAPRSAAPAKARTSPPVQKLVPSLTSSAAPTSAGSTERRAAATEGKASPSSVPCRPRATRSRSTRSSTATAAVGAATVSSGGGH